jgi:hypothetical protein
MNSAPLPTSGSQQQHLCQLSQTICQLVNAGMALTLAVDLDSTLPVSADVTNPSDTSDFL